jgi:hypothetical protein
MREPMQAVTARRKEHCDGDTRHTLWVYDNTSADATHPLVLQAQDGEIRSSKSLLHRGCETRSSYEIAPRAAVPAPAHV